MDPSGLCPFCGRFYSGGNCYCSAEADDNSDSIPFLDKIVKVSESCDDLGGKSTKTGTDFTSPVFEGAHQKFSEQDEDQNDSMPSPLVKRNPLLSELNPPTPKNEESSINDTQEDPQMETSTDSNKSSPTFSQLGDPPALPFPDVDPVDSNDSEKIKDPIDLSEKKDANSDANTKSIVQDLNKQKICGTPSKDDQSRSTSSSSLESTESRNKFEGQPSCSHADPSRLGSSRHYRTKSKKSSQKHLLRKSFPCNECEQVLASKRALADHMFLHSKERLMKCKHSGDVSEKDTSNDAKIENIVKDLNKQHICGTPSKDDQSRLTSSSLLESQSQFEGQPSCSQAGPSGLGSGEYSRTQSPTKNLLRKLFPCSECGKELSSKRTLADHMFLHTNKKPVKCDLCGSTFALKKYLYVHKRTHTGERPYTCKMCGKVFPYRNSLNAHIRVHKEKLFTCTFCDKQFSRSFNCSRHIRSHTTS